VLGQLIGVLVTHGTQVNERDLSQRTPLHLAAKVGHCNTVRALLGKNILTIGLWSSPGLTGVQ
jgi:ankyrin repeat protein